MRLFRPLSLLLLTSGLLPAQTTSVTATKDDGTPAATKKPAGSTVTYSNTITNTGANAATNLSFADPDITNATLVSGSIHISPLAINDSYETIANTQITVAPSAGSSPEVYVNSTVRSNDQTLNPPGGTDTSSIVSSTSPANGTLVAFNTTTGAFTYQPNAGFIGTDSFTYTVRNDADSTLTDTATVSIVVKDSNPSVTGNQSVWYVKNDGAAGNGRSSSPFNTLAGAQSASAAGDTIYVFTGDGTTSGQNAGIALKSGQRLIGQGVALTVPVQVNGGAVTTTLNLAGSQPRVGNSAGNGVSVIDIIPAEIQGLSLSGSANAIDFTYASAAAPTAATCHIKNNTIFGAGADGIDINKDGNFTLGLDIQSNTWNAAGTHTGNAVDILRAAAGTPGLVQLVFSNNSLLSTGANALNVAGNTGVTITGFSGNSISGNTTGSGIVCDSVLFDADTGAAGFQQVAGGVTVVGGSGNGVGASGIVLTNTSGDLSFTGLDVFADGGAALRATATAAYTGAAGFRVAVADGLGSMVATGGPAVDASMAQLNLPNMLVTSSGSATFGANFSDTDGSTFTTRTGSSVSASNAAATAFRVANANGTYTFTGPITTSAGKGVELTNNSGATISFTGGLSLSTGANPAFVATGGGTVTATQNNSTIVNTLTTTSAQALNVASTTIGAAGLTFRSISSGAGASNGITLNSTGSSGGLSIVGTGSAGSGGTISGKTGGNGSTTGGIGIYLIDTINVSLDRMTLQNFENFAIRGFNVNGFSLLNSTVNTTSGFNGNDATTNEGSIAFGDQLNASLSGLSGTVAITNCVIANGYEDNFVISNHTGTMNFTMTGSTVRDTSTVSPGNEGLAFYAEGSSVMNISVQSSSFLRNRANGIHVINQSTGTVTFDLGAPGSSGSGGIFTNNTIGVNIVGNDSGATNFDILNATFTVPNFPALYNAGGASSQININMGGDAVVAERGAMSGNILNNSIDMNGSPTGPAVRIIANGTDNTGGNEITFKLDGNNITGGENRGIDVLTRDGNAGINATITNNTVTTNDGTLIPGNGALNAIIVVAGATSTAAGTGVPDSGFVNLDLANNNAEAPDGILVFDVRIRQRFATTYRLKNYAGAAANDAAVIAYLAARNTGTTGPETFTADHAATGSIGFLNIINVPLPAAPLLFAPGEPEDFGFGVPDSVESAIAWTEAARRHGVDTASTGASVSPVTPAPTSSANNGEGSPVAHHVLTQDEIIPLVTAARERWAATGLTAAQVGILEDIKFKVIDLPGWYLGENAGSEVRLDLTAGGNGWFVDATPMDDQEFIARETSMLRASDGSGSPASGRIDLLTTIMHEMGHRLGLCDAYSGVQRGGIMYGFLTKGERRLPVKGEADGAVPHAHSTPHHLGAPITISELPVGKSVTIKYSVTVNNDPLTWVGATLSSQASITSSNAEGASGYFPPVVTNDPESPAANDATITLLDRPDATVASINRTVSTPNKEASVTWQVVFSTPIKGLTASNLSLTTTGTIAGASISSVVAAGGSAPDDSWNVTVNTGTGDGTIGLNQANDTSLTHELTNLSFTGQTITIDKTVPTVGMSTLASNPTNVSPIPVSVTFSESVTGFTSGDITPGNATVSNFAGSGANYTFDLVPSGQGTVTADIAADVAQDGAGNNNTAATQFSRTYDSVAPTVAMTSATGDPAVNAAIPVTVQFSESVTGFGTAEITVANATLSNFVAVDADTYTFDLTPSGPGVTVTADIAGGAAQDAAGNNSTAATQFSRTIVDQVSIAATTGTAVEGGATGLCTFTRSLTTGALTVNFQLAGTSTATAGTDFNLSSSGTLTFNTGSGAGSIVIPNGSATATVILTALVESPNAAEAAESARLNVVAGTGYVAAAAPNDNATVNITENSFLVTTTADSGTGSLRQAVLNANSLAGTDTIIFDPTAFAASQIITLTTAGDPTAGPSALAISTPIIVRGPAMGLTIAGGGPGSSMRAFYIAPTGDLTLGSLTLSNFRHAGGLGFGGAAGMGGVIFNNGGILTIINSVVTGCEAAGGSNLAGYGGGGLGGLGGNLGGGPNGGSFGAVGIGGNGGFGGGGGAGALGGGNGGFGGGAGLAVISGTNGKGGFGGGGSAGLAGFGGGDGGGAGLGGGVFNNGGTVRLLNTTFTANTVVGGSGTTLGKGYGGAVFSRNGTLILEQCTVSGNTAADGGRGVYVLADTSDGGNNTSPGNGNANVQISNSILGGSDTAITDFVSATNGAGPFGGTSAGSGNLIRSQSGFGGSSVSSGDPLLGALQDNGGPTRTMSLLSGSPALNAGLPANIPADTFDLDGDTNTTEPIPFDQRGAGFVRAIGTVDIGAFEFQKSVSIANVTATNEGNSGTTNFVFTITRSGDTTGDVNMTYTVGGAAVNAADFGGTLPTGSATITNGSATTTVTIPVSGDTLVELNEAFTVTLSSPDNGYVVSGAPATSTITNDDSATISIAKITDGAEANTPTNGKFRVTQTATSSTDTTVSYTVSGTATSGTDFTALSGSVTILAGQTTADIDVTVLNDGTTLEPTETVIATLNTVTAGSSSITVGATNEATMDITDDDTATLTIAKINDGSETGPASALFRVTQTATATVDTVLTYTVGGTATSGSDFTAPSGSVTITAGQTTADISVTISNDSIVEATETISLTLTGFTARDPDVSLGATVLATADISDNDSATVTIAKINDGSEIGPANALFRVTQTAKSSSATTLTYTVGGTAASGSDFTALSGSVSIPAGSTTADITVTVANDAIVEATETVALTLSGFTARDADIELGANVDASADITDNDSATVTIAKINDGVEAAVPTNALFRVTQTAAASVDTVISYSIGGSATSGSDFTALGGSVAILTGNTTADISVAVLNENLVEATETVSLTLTGFTARDPEVTLGATVDASADITDSDTSVITLAAVNADQNEGTGGTTTSFTFSATLSNPVQGGFTIAYATDDGTALTADSDYQDNDSTLDFTGTAAESKTITVLANHDGANEADETFTVALGSITGTTLGGSLSTTGSPQTGTIRNDDALTVAIAATDADADENTAGTGTFRVSRNGVLGDVTVQIAIDAGSTAVAADWTQSGATFGSLAAGSTGSVIIPDGQTFVDITLTPSADLHAEAAETVRLDVTADAAYTIGSPANATVTIGQNDFMVINTDDAGEGTLRQAVLNANSIAGTDTITFSDGIGGTVDFTDATADTILLSSGQISIDSNATIAGTGADRLIVQNTAAPSPTSRVFRVETPGTTVTLRGMTITGGDSTEQGGGILTGGAASTLFVFDCAVTGNSATSYGGGIRNTSAGTLFISNSTISNNESSIVQSGGGIDSSATLTVINSTISGNTASGSATNTGGGIWTSGAATIINSTITNNTANGAGGIFRGGGAITVSNSIIAGNADNTNKPDVAGSFTSGDGNIIGNFGTATGFTGTSDLTGTGASPVNPLLGPLADNGGPTLTHMLLNGSPAINNGLVANLPADTYDLDGDMNVAEALPLDQRGGVNLRQRGPAPDSGAVEAFAFEPTITASPATNEDTQTTSGLVISRNTADGGLTTHYQITGITGGTLFQSDGTTPIAENDYITLTQGAAGLKFTPGLNLNTTTTPLFGFTIQAAVGTTTPDLRGATVSTTISVTPVNDAPTVVPPGIPDQSMTIGTTLVIPLPAHFADVELDTLTFSVSGNTVPAKASASITGVTNVSVTGLTNGVTQVTITANDSNGGTVTDTFQVAVGTANPTASQVGTSAAYSAQTGLFPVTVNVTNTTAFAIRGFRLHVIFGAYLAAHPSLRLYNATNAPGANPAYVDHLYPVEVGQTVPVQLLFYTNNRRFPNPFTPVMNVETLPQQNAAVPVGPGVPITDIRMLADGTKLLEWNTVAGRWYQIRFSHNLAEWFICPVPIQAGSNRQQWIDSGAPFTPTSSAEPGSRFYRVEEINVPTP